MLRKPLRFPGAILGAYAGTIFLSAFLLFAIQPIAGKSLLPLFGGGAAVWSVSLVFFMTILVVGYFYSYLLSALRIRTQIFVHGSLVAASVVYVAATFIMGEHSFVPVLGSLASWNEEPAYHILRLLLFTLGLPIVTLATTSSLLQNWFGRTTGRSPYHLYSLSNTGSLLALIGYPFFIEPLIRLSDQADLWAGIYVLYALGVGIVLLQLWSGEKKRVIGGTSGHHVLPRAAISARQWTLWLGLGALPSFMLVASTAKLTQSVAAVPFLWIVPLALYLISFILAFSDRLLLSRRALSLLALFAIVSAIYVSAGNENTRFLVAGGIYAAALFFLSLACHRELYLRRPALQGLTLFYLIISAGGALGGAAGSLLAPSVFNDYFEFPLALWAGFVAVGVIARQELALPRRTLLVASALVCAAVFAGYATRQMGYAASFRNFYAAIHIASLEDPPHRQLVDGNIVHGSQYLAAEKRREPTTYFGRESGAGQAVAYVRGRQEQLSVGVAGLGAGTLAAYCERGDRFVFYEINPAVIRAARDQFTFLADCPGSLDVVAGDARNSLALENLQHARAPFDLLVVDVFTDDAIPVHLLTREAIAIYLERLKPDGVLAINITNRHLDLEPVLAAAANFHGLGTVTIDHDPPSGTLEFRSRWVLLSRDPNFSRYPFANTRRRAPDKPEVIWTDDFSNLFRAISFRRA